MDGLLIDPESAVAPFEQLRQHILEQVSSGSLAAGAKLPTVRRLADDLGLAANTVAKAYRELETAGIIETRGRAGSFVSAQGDVVEQSGQRAARDYADSIRKLGIDADTALAWAQAALRS
ncbi:GntR family transcriptional regulator [Salinibacterium hongtaonis]|uniref:GntR family transcriptional regulator n=1 Tax=Homoserinimonas hongtaonis TaxID=2079791 RepID=UPI0018F01088|nr:GntR family transcriptional regulator [Salinibacterium hongtaonis]